MKQGKIVFIFELLIVFLVAFGCKIKYTATGADIGDAKTVSILYFPNQAPIVQPTLSDDFTNALKDRFSSQTTLEPVNRGGDLNFEGEIIGYSITPQDITGEETASMMRLTISVHVVFVNSKNDKWDFDQKFSRYADYPSEQDLDDAVAGGLHETIIEELTEDIFNKSVVNW